MSTNNMPTSMKRAYGLAILRLVLVAAGILIAVMPFDGTLSSVLGDPSRVQTWWLVMVACGLCMTAATAGTQWQWTGLLAASLLAGTSAQLVVTQTSAFQYIYIRPISNFSYVPLLAIAAQALLTAGVLLRPRIIFGIFRFLSALGVARTALLVVLALGFSVTIMRYVGNQDYLAYLNQLFLAGGFLFLNVATTVAVALHVPSQLLGALAKRVNGMISFPGTTEDVRTFDRHLPLAVALWTLIVSSLLCVFAFERIPHVIDEVVYLFQSKYFLQGRISVPAPPSVDAFIVNLVDFVGDEWFSIMPPGWPLVLALGTALKLSWLVNPILSAVCILLAHAVFRRVSDRGTANAVILLLAISPWFLAMSASLLSHTLTLAAMLAAWLLLLRARAEHSVLAAVLAGGSMGLVFLTRYLDGLIVGILTGLWTLSFLVDRSRWSVVVGYGIGCIAIGALVFPYNQQLTGDPFRTTLETYFDHLWHPGANRLGFGPDIGPGPQSNWIGELYPGHSLTEALVHFQHNTHTVAVELFGWGTASLAFVFAHLIWGRWSRNDLYMAAIIAATIGALSAFWFSGGFYIGARYWFMTLLPFVAISVSGIGTLSRKLEIAGGGAPAAQRLAFVIALLCVFSVASFLPWRGVAKYNVHRNALTDYRDLLEEHDLDGSLILVQARSTDEFTNAFFLNSPDLSGPGPIFARDLGPESNRSLAQAFPDRPIYFVVGRSSDGRKAHIVKGPVPSSTLH